MSRQRKTRAQKAKVAEHRSRQISRLNARVGKLAPAELAPTHKPLASPEPSDAPASHRRELRRSLRIMGLLISFQMVLWQIWQHTEFDAWLARLIKV